MVLEPKQIAKAYLRGWFIIDFVSSIPFDYLTLFARTGGEETDILRIGKLIIFMLLLAH